jgi:hypothetical protein
VLGCDQDLSDDGGWNESAGCCEDGNEISGFVKAG